MSLTIQSGPATVIASGMATCFLGHPLSFDLDVKDTTHKVVLFFEADEQDTSCRVASTRATEGWFLRLINFDAAHGKGSSEPVLLAEFEDSSLFFHFRTFLYGQTLDRSVHYTFFTVQKADVSSEAG